MRNLINRRLAAFDRVVDFGATHTLTPALALATTLHTQLGAIATDLRICEGGQCSGRGDYLGGASRRRQTKKALLAKMRPLNRIARALDREQYPEARAQFKMTTRAGYEAVIGQASAFLTALTTMKPVFISHGLAADFDEQLQAAKDELIAATERKNNGRIAQASNTAGLQSKSDEGMRILRQLDGIMSARYESDPALLAGWRTARRVERAPRRSTASGSTGGKPTPPPTSTPTPAPTA